MVFCRMNPLRMKRLYLILRPMNLLSSIPTQFRFSSSLLKGESSLPPFYLFWCSFSHQAWFRTCGYSHHEPLSRWYGRSVYRCWYVHYRRWSEWFYYIYSDSRIYGGGIQFVKTLFPPKLVSFLHPMTTTVFMLCCGALVRERESFLGLQGMIH